MIWRPSIERIVADELYHTQRLLLDAEAKRDQARVALAHHEVQVEMLGERCRRLKRATSQEEPKELPQVLATETLAGRSQTPLHKMYGEAP